MKYTVFYSWQSDLPNAANRSFIQDALERAASGIAKDDTVEVDPVVDRDTLGAAGAPDIAATIFAKIDAAEAFVCDVSFVAATDKDRFLPNPNVLVELGYAIRALGWDRIIPVFNTHTGRVEDLPFDLRNRRVVPYLSRPEDEQRADEKKRLTGVFDNAIRSVIALGSKAPAAPPPPSHMDLAVQAIEERSPRARAAIRDFMAFQLEQIVSRNPQWNRDTAWHEQLVSALAGTESLVAEFSQVAQAIADTANEEALFLVHEHFQELVNMYYPPRVTGSYSEWDFDFYKFLGHELFVTLVCPLVAGRQWGLLNSLLDKDLFIERRSDKRSGGVERYTTISAYIASLAPRDQALRRVSTHADILNERHTEGELGTRAPMELFASTDFLLFIRSVFEADDPYHCWRPWSVIYLKEPPRYLQMARRASLAEEFLPAIKATSVQQVRDELMKRTTIVTKLFPGNPFYDGPLEYYEPKDFGTT